MAPEMTYIGTISLSDVRTSLKSVMVDGLEYLDVEFLGIGRVGHALRETLHTNTNRATPV